MSSSFMLRILAVVCGFIPWTIMGCTPDDSGKIDLKRGGEPSPDGPAKPRAFRPGELEER